MPESVRKDDGDDLMPRVSPWRVHLFTRYVFHYMGRSFHRVGLSCSDIPQSLPHLPVIVYINHPSWWDPLFCIVLARKLFPHRKHYAPMHAGMLRRYRFFARLGFFGIEPRTLRGARLFLRIGESILRQKSSMLWITPQGDFADPRIRPVQFQPGLGHLAYRTQNCIMLPIALEYPFWEERFPEALARCGKLIVRDEQTITSPRSWSRFLEQRLESVQDALGADTIRRNYKAFETLLAGRAGVGGVYDLWRLFKAKMRHEEFSAEHREPQ